MLDADNYDETEPAPVAPGHVSQAPASAVSHREHELPYDDDEDDEGEDAGATGDNPLNNVKEQALEDIKGSQSASPASTAVYHASTAGGSRRGSNDSENGANEDKSGSSLGSGSQKSNGGSSSGIQVTKNEMGAISFKLPGRITHKTTIKLAHYPQPGTEIINIEAPPPEACISPDAAELPALEDECSPAEVCVVCPEEDCCIPPPGNFTNNCNFCTYNVGGQQHTSCETNTNCAPTGCPSPHALMQHSLRMQQQMRHQQMCQQRQQYQQLSNYYSAFNANNIFRQYYPPGANSYNSHSHPYQNHAGYGQGHGYGQYGYPHSSYHGQSQSNRGASYSGSGYGGRC
jgi:hypothetical protein